MRRAVADLDAAWRAADTAPDGLLTVIAALAHAPADVVIAGLLPWLSNTHWLRDRLDAALALLAADPFTRPPLRMVGGGDDGPGGLVLADHGAVRLTLQLRPFSANEAAPGTAVFVPGGAAIHVLDGGGAELRAHSVAVSAAEEAGGFTAQGAARCHSQPPRPLRTGETLILDTARQSFTLQHGRAGARSDNLYLELTVQPCLCHRKRPPDPRQRLASRQQLPPDGARAAPPAWPHRRRAALRRRDGKRRFRRTLERDA